MKRCQNKITPITSDNFIKALINVSTLFKTEVTASPRRHSLSTLNHLLFFKKHKIPSDYQTVLDWLANIARCESFSAMKGEQVDNFILAKALAMSLEYIRSFPKGNECASSALVTIMENMMKQFNIHLEHNHLFGYLEKYCQTNGVNVPEEIQIINQFMTRTLEPRMI